MVGWLLFRNFVEGGTDIRIVFSDAHGLRENGSNVEYRGLKIGSVTGLTLTGNGKAVEVSANIDSSASKYLTTGALFWLNGANPSISNLFVPGIDPLGTHHYPATRTGKAGAPFSRT